MAEVTMKLNYSAFTQIRNCGAIQQLMMQYASAMQSAAEIYGGEYTADVQPGQKRAHAIVGTWGKHAERANAKYNALAKSIGAGG